jgi:hypothetical protein
MPGSELSRGGRQHGEEIDVLDTATASHLGAVFNDAADPGADQRPAADGGGAPQLADAQGERDVGVERVVGVRRRVEGGRRVSGPNRYKMVAGPLEPSQRTPVGSRVSPHPPVVPSNGRRDPPPLKWSDLRYVFDIQEDCNGKEAIQA